jgi:hypothetical protein
MKEARTHIEALQKMVAVRGGIGNIRSSSPVTASVAFWYETTSTPARCVARLHVLTISIHGRFSLVLTLEPQFPPEESTDLYYPLQWLQKISESSQASGLLDFDEYGICKNISDILLEVRYISRFFPTHLDDTSSSNSNDLDIHSTICSILQRLLQTEPNTDAGPRAACITQCCRFGAAIFLLFPFENHYPDPTRLINSLVHKLQNALESIVPFLLNVNKLPVWLFSVGGVAALNLPAERAWFVGHLTELAVELRLVSWDEGKSCLEMVVWIDAMDDQPFHQLWKEVLINVTRMTPKVPFCSVRY